ncbi:plasmid pRiA4b ORF-3 family protein [Endozoicomonas sp. SM1973]|uniref:Plasmid pRiA4b ORF-3 family protein n=1 Tax=Spartinivicinus marinus TaxID=2994442 RepID=A0A853IQ27_9GAMM|nr:plasmid pRiA4b ORF-3 family protein [Spartinivicinus marinus]NYZ70016.1 plasmid pRiA4b ORF-3 family protein [Spartinivicinus marinus]
MTVKPLRSVYQVKILLMDSKPPVWRRLLIRSDIRLNVFHTAIQSSMGWEDCHLHQFRKDGMVFGAEEDNEFKDDFVKNETQYKLSDLLKKEKESLHYEYDFGDSWMHKITLEKILPFDSSTQLVQCIKGKRACPPEDCGGIWRYEFLLEAISDPSHEEHEEMLSWLGGEFDPEYLDLNAINHLLSESIQQEK